MRNAVSVLTLATLAVLAGSVPAHGGCYEEMRPGEIRAAIAAGQALLIPVGVLEFHGEQNPVGVDALICQGIARRVEEQTPCVVAPTFFFGHTGNWAGGIKEGEIDIDGKTIYAHAKPILKAFHDQGWKRIYVMIHHQGPGGVTWAAWQMAAREVIDESARAAKGDGWHPYADTHKVFARIAVVSDSQFSSTGYPGHGGRGETSAMLSLYPHTVDLSVLAGKPQPRWNQDAPEATAKEGAEIREKIVAAWVKHLREDTK
jgi:creatinine amidohydrolase